MNSGDISRANVFLAGLSDYEKSTGFRYDTKNYNLARMREMLEAAGNPQRDYRCVIVAGTKGKGSVSAFLASILAASGLRAGLFTSPHLVDWTERIRMGLEPVSPGEFADLALAVEGALPAGANPPTVFEALTVMALSHFRRAGAGLAVLEVGMGGRLDAVNAAEADAVAMTPISLDHTGQLGDTIPLIAGEKAGVIKSAAPVVCGRQEPGALQVFTDACRRTGAPLHLVGRDITTLGERFTAGGASFDAMTPWGEFRGLEIGLAGRHQLGNALVALGTALALGGKTAVTEAGIREGLRAARWPGRLQLVPGEPRLLLDGAHNVASAQVLADYLREFHPGTRIHLVLGMLQGKDHDGFVRTAVPGAATLHLPSLVHPRAVPAEGLAKLAGGIGAPPRICGSVAEAVAAAREDARGGGLVVVTGSLSLVGEVLALEG